MGAALSVRNKGFSRSFPPEILDEIIKHFVNSFSASESWIIHSRRDAIANLALVSKQFCVFTQEHIFKKIDLQAWHITDKTGQRRRNLALLLKDKPHLAHAVRTVEYDHGGIETTPCDETLSTLLHLPNVKTLRVLLTSAAPVPYVAVDDLMTNNHIPRFDFRRILKSYLEHDSTITTLVIRGVRNVPLRKILSHPSLQTLRISQCPNIDTEPMATTTGTTELTDSVHTQAPIGPFNLKNLSIRKDFSEPQVMPISIFDQCPHLETMAVDQLSCDDPSPTLNSNLLPFQKLVSAAVFHETDIHRWIDVATDNVISSSPAFPRLERLNLRLRWRDRENVRSRGGSYEDELHRLFCNTPLLHDLIFRQASGLTDPVIKLSRAFQPISQSLKTLIMCLPFHRRSADPVIAMERLKAFIDDLSLLRLPALEELTLQIKLPLQLGPGGNAEYSQLEELQRLKPIFEGVLSDKASFPLLQTLAISFKLKFAVHNVTL